MLRRTGASPATREPGEHAARSAGGVDAALRRYEDPRLEAEASPERREPDAAPRCDETAIADDGPAPLISIVTVCFNSAKTIGDTLASVDALLPSGPADVEHIVVDGLSSDDTVAIVNAHPNRIRRLVSERDTGIYSAMNKGLQRARGQYVWFLNSDDYLHPEVQKRWPALLDILRRVQPAILVGEVQMFQDSHEGGAAARRTRYWKVPANIDRARHFGWHPPHPAFVARRQLLNDLGGFDESKTISADFKLMTKAIEANAAGVATFLHPMVLMREGGVSNRSVRAILNANRQCYASLCELGQSRGAAGLGICLKLSRKVGQKLMSLWRSSAMDAK